VCCLLLEASASLDTADREGMTALHWAAATGKQFVVSKMLDVRPDLVDARADNAEVYQKSPASPVKSPASPVIETYS